MSTSDFLHLSLRDHPVRSIRLEALISCFRFAKSRRTSSLMVKQRQIYILPPAFLYCNISSDNPDPLIHVWIATQSWCCRLSSKWSNLSGAIDALGSKSVASRLGMFMRWKLNPIPKRSCQNWLRGQSHTAECFARLFSQCHACV